jgi:hypothetical protein
MVQALHTGLVWFSSTQDDASLRFRICWVWLYLGGRNTRAALGMPASSPPGQQSPRWLLTVAPGEERSVLYRRHPAGCAGGILPPSRGRDALGAAAGTAALLFRPSAPEIQPHPICPPACILSANGVPYLPEKVWSLTKRRGRYA